MACSSPASVRPQRCVDNVLHAPELGRDELGEHALIGELLTKPAIGRHLIPPRVKVLPVLAGQSLDGVGLKPQPPPFGRPGLARFGPLRALAVSPVWKCTGAQKPVAIGVLAFLKCAAIHLAVRFGNARSLYFIAFC